MSAPSDPNGPAFREGNLSLPLFSVDKNEKAVFRLVETSPKAAPYVAVLQVFDDQGRPLVQQKYPVTPTQAAALEFRPGALVTVRGAARVILDPSPNDPRSQQERLSSIALSIEIFAARPATQPIGTGGGLDHPITNYPPSPPVEPVRIFGVGPYAPSTE